MTIAAIIGIAWASTSIVVAMAFGRSITRADRAEQVPAWTDDVEQFLRDQAAQNSN